MKPNVPFLLWSVHQEDNHLTVPGLWCLLHWFQLGYQGLLLNVVPEHNGGLLRPLPGFHTWKDQKHLQIYNKIIPELLKVAKWKGAAVWDQSFLSYSLYHVAHMSQGLWPGVIVKTAQSVKYFGKRSECGRVIFSQFSPKAISFQELFTFSWISFQTCIYFSRSDQK